MSFSNSQHTNASGSNFTDVSGNHNATVIKELKHIQVVNNFFSVPTPFIQHSSHDFAFPELHDPTAYFNTRAQVPSGATTPISWPVLLQNSSKHLPSASDLKTVMPSQIILADRLEITHSNEISGYLIVKIVELLVHPDCSDHYRNLHQELGSLQKMFALTKIAIKACESMPLGHSLAGAINREVDGCSVVLQALLGKIKR